MNEKECDKAKNDFVVALINNLCTNDKACIKAIADAILSGKLPLTYPVLFFLNYLFIGN